MKDKMKNIVSKINVKYLFVLLPAILIVLLLIVSSICGTIKEKEIKKEESKEITYKTKDNKVSYTFKETFKTSEVGEYDLYVKDDKRQMIMGVFTYTLSDYEENSAKEILDNQIEYFKKTRNDMKIYKKEEVQDLSDKVITKVEYSGKSTDSSDCIYIFSVTEFKNAQGYVLYSNQVLLKSDYENNSEELYNILKSAKLE